MSQDNLQLWLKADALGLANGATVAEWGDSSGNANHAAQAVAGNQPTYVSSVTGLNAKPVVRFQSATKKYLTVPHVPGLMPTEGVTVIAVASRTVAAGLPTSAMMIVEKGITGDTNSGYSLRFQGTASAGYYIHADGSSSVIAGNTYYILAGTYDRVANDIYVNGAAGVTSPYTAAIAPRASGLSIGGRLAAGTLAPANNLEGDIAEILVYGRSISRAERRDIEAYLHAKYTVGTAPQADLPVFSVATGTYAGPQVVTLDCPAMPGATLRYTTNGSDPTEASQVYAGTFTVSASTTIKARAFKAGYVQPAEPAETVITLDSQVANVPRQGMQVWLRADSLSLADEASVVKWVDQSGRGNHAVGGTAAPTYEVSGPNSKPAIEFASGQYLSIPNSPSVQAEQLSVFAVVKRASGTAAAVIVEKFVTTGVGYSLFMPNATTMRYTVGSNSATATLVSPVNGYVVASAVFDQITARLHLNGATPPASVARIAEVPANTLPIYIGGRAAASTLFGEIAEIIMYDRGLSEAERLDVEAYFYAKYAIGVKPTLGVPEFNLQNGTYATPPEVRISAQPGAQISYSIGAVIDQTYTGAFRPSLPVGQLQGSIIVTAKAIKPGYVDSATSTLTLRIKPEADQIPRSDLQLWLKADSLSQADGSAVSLWPDLSGKGNHAHQDTTPTRQPKFAANGVAAGKPAIEFTASELDHLIVANVPGLNPSAMTVIAVAKRKAVTAIRDTIIVKGSDTSGYGLLYGDASSNIHSTINANNVEASVAVGEYNLLALSYDGATQTLVYNGEVVSDGYASSIALGSADLTVGGSGATKALDGFIAELQVYSRALSVDEITEIQSKLHQEYGVGTLPRASTPVPNVKDRKIVTDESPELVLSAASDATIFYTTDPLASSSGLSVPLPVDSPWSVYSGPIPLAGAVTYRFLALRPNHQLSHEASIRAMGDATARSVTDAKPKIWYRADSLDLADLATVSSWKNSAESGTVGLQQGTSTRKPRMRLNAVGGNPAVEFDGTSDFLRTDAGGYLNYQAGTIIVVAKPIDDGTNQYIFRDVDEGRIYDYSQRGYAGERWTGPALYSANGKAVVTLLYPNNPQEEPYDVERYKVATHSAGRTAGSYAIIGGTWQALKTAAAYVNYAKGTAALSQVKLADTGYDLFTVGAATANDGSYGGFYRGELAEMIIFDRVLNVDERTKVNAYLNGRYGINESLPPIMEPRFSPSGGTYVSESKVTIHAEVPAKIYYDVNQDPFDGDVPRSGLTPQSSGVQVAVSATKTLHARAAYLSSGNIVRPGAASEVVAATFIIDPSTAKVSRDGLRLWLRADSLGLSEGAAVAEWQDQSGKGHHAAQSTVAQQPTYVASSGEIKNRPAIRFGVGGYKNLIIPDVSSLDVKQLSIMAVMKRMSGTGTGVVYTRSDGTDGYDMLAVGMGSVQVGINSSNLSGSLPAARQGVYNVVFGSYDQSFMRFYLNGALLTEIAATNELRPHSRDVAIGATASTNALHGEIAELFVYDRALGDLERQALHEYIYAKYGVGPQATLRRPEFRLLDDTLFSDGAYATSQTIKIISPDEKPIRYTVDGSVPTAASALYTAPLSLAGSQTIRAIACESGFADSPVAVLRFAYSSVPGLPTDNGAPSAYQLDTDGDGVPDAIEGAIGSDPNNPASTGNGVGRTYQYDPIHQLTHDGVKTYNYDAEGNASRN